MHPMSTVQRLLAPVVQVRREEAGSLLLMFLYSFLVMTAYSIVKPLTRAQFIGELGADNLPWVLLVSGVLVGLMMQLYTRAAARLPPRSVIAATQIGIAAMLVGFWVLFRAGAAGTPVAFYLVGQILGLLLISQFWVLANDIYDARQAKRLFGFIGGGASLGGMTASAVVVFSVDTVGTANLLLLSAALLLVCAGVVTTVMRRARDASLARVASSGEPAGVGGGAAFRMLRESRHVQLIATIIGFAAIGAGLLDQQLNMAVEESAGAGGADRIAAFLGQVQFYLSAAGFVIQVWLTSRIHRHFGIGFALLILPIGLGSTGGLILATGALWAAAAGRVLDSSLRYSVDKTTREILFLPLPADLKHQAKPLIDVTVDRFAKGIGAALTLVLIQPWGFGLAWHQLSWVSLGITALWVGAAVQARRQYLASFRQSIARQQVLPADVRLTVADLSTVETLVEELAHPDENRVLYAIDVLESLDKRHLVTPLLLHHDAAAVRARALGALGAARADLAARWAPAVERLVKDADPNVRVAAVQALAAIRNEEAACVSRALVDDADPRVVATAAVLLSRSDDPDDRRTADRALAALTADARQSAGPVRRDLAAAIRQLGATRSHDLLMDLLYDADPAVCEEAMRTVRALDLTDVRFAPTLLSFLGDRERKSGARETLIRYGEPVIGVLRHVLDDQDEDIWVRRHIPATLARIPCQASMDILAATLGADDSFLRFKALAAAEKLRRDHPELRFDPALVERLAPVEGRAYFSRLDHHYSLFVGGALPTDAVLARALQEKADRAVDRIYRLLSLVHAWKDVAAARWAIEHGDARGRAGALEYLDNVIGSSLRGLVMPVIDAAPVEEKVRHARTLLKTGPRDAEATLAALIADDDPVVAAAALDLIGAERIWSLRDRVEQLLADGEAPDPYVADAASWTLAAHAAAQRQRPRHQVAALPAAALVDRLRTLMLFSSVGVDELFRIAHTGHQTRLDPGVTVLREGSRPDQLHLLLDGEVAATRRGAAPHRIVPPAALGFEEALAGHPVADTIRTIGPAVLISFNERTMRTLLSDNIDLVQGLFRVAADVRGIPKGVIEGPPAADLEPFTGTLTDGQKGLALRHIPPFAQVTGVEMLHLAAIATQRTIEPEAVFTDQTAPEGVGIVLSGKLGLRTDDDRRETVIQASPGNILGLYGLFAGRAAEGTGPVPGDGSGSWRVVAVSACSLLWIDRDDFFDLLSQRSDLLQQIFASGEEYAPVPPPPPPPRDDDNAAPAAADAAAR